MSDPYREKIAKLMEAEEASGAKARKLGDPVPNIDAVTTDWLTDVMCRNTPGAEAVDFEVRHFSSGTHDRHRILVTYNEAGRNADLPASIFTKTLPTLDQRALSGIAAVRESYFYNHIRQQLDIEAPRCYASTVIPRSFATIHAMEDMVAAKGAKFADYRLHVTRDMAENIITLIAALHASFLDSPQLGTHEKVVPRFWRQFTAFCEITKVEKYTEVSLIDSGDRIPARLMKRLKEIWPATVAAIEFHRSASQTIIHSDIHIGNWYQTQSGAMGLADWQFMGIGHWARDLSYVLSTALLPEDRRVWEKDLVRLYAAELSRHSRVRVDFDDAWRFYRQQMLTALAMWTITLRHDDTMPDMQPEDMSLAMVERMAIAIDDLDALDSFA
jgi:thiamine kinase-like enzyme